MVAFLGTDVSPSSACSSPTIIRNKVVLPDPFGPTRPTLSPGLSWKDASTNRTCRPYCLLMRENAIMLETKLRAQTAEQRPPRQPREPSLPGLVEFHAAAAGAERSQQGFELAPQVVTSEPAGVDHSQHVDALQIALKIVEELPHGPLV